MKKISIIICTVLIAVSIRGQQLSQQVIGSSGACFEASSGMTLSFSLGECVTETYSNSSVILSQGFQQGYFEVQPLAVSDEISIDMNVYPLPAKDYITIEFNDSNKEYLAEIYDINGKLILTEELDRESTNLSLGTLITGTYILVIEDNAKNTFKTMQIIKY